MTAVVGVGDTPVSRVEFSSFLAAKMPICQNDFVTTVNENLRHSRPDKIGDIV